MHSQNADTLISRVQSEQDVRGELANQTLNWFLNDEPDSGTVGELYARGELAAELADQLDISRDKANMSLSDTVGDVVDPVQQVSEYGDKYVGVIDYQEFPDGGAYGYVDFDDKVGKRNRVVCARCVETHEYDHDVAHATQGEGSCDSDASWGELVDVVTAHYETTHTTNPSAIQPGASLTSDTTISGSTAIHVGNADTSGIDADSVDGVEGTLIDSQTTRLAAENRRT